MFVRRFALHWLNRWRVGAGGHKAGECAMISVSARRGGLRHADRAAPGKPGPLPECRRSWGGSSMVPAGAFTLRGWVCLPEWVGVFAGKGGRDAD